MFNVIPIKIPMGCFCNVIPDLNSICMNKYKNIQAKVLHEKSHFNHILKL